MFGGGGIGEMKLCINNFAGKPLRKRPHCRQRRLRADILLLLYNRTNEMHFLSFIFENNFYNFFFERQAIHHKEVVLYAAFVIYDAYQTLRKRSPIDDE
jgi:hypothetical protein